MKNKERLALRAAQKQQSQQRASGSSTRERSSNPSSGHIVPESVVAVWGEALTRPTPMASLFGTAGSAMSYIGLVEWRIASGWSSSAKITAHLVNPVTGVSICGNDDHWGKKVYESPTPRVQCKSCVRIYKTHAYKKVGG